MDWRRWLYVATRLRASVTPRAVRMGATSAGLMALIGAFVALPSGPASGKVVAQPAVAVHVAVVSYASNDDSPALDKARRSAVISVAIARADARTAVLLAARLHEAHLAHVAHLALLAARRAAAQAAAQAALVQRQAASRPAASAPRQQASAPSGSGCSDPSGQLSDAQVVMVWECAGGPSWAASAAVAISLCESGHNTGAYNPSGATGLFQILGSVVPGSLYDAHVNALNAVSKFTASGDSWAQWVCQP